MTMSMWRIASPASNPVAKLTLLYIPLGHCYLSTLSALMAELTSVGTKKKTMSMWTFLGFQTFGLMLSHQPHLRLCKGVNCAQTVQMLATSGLQSWQAVSRL